MAVPKSIVDAKGSWRGNYKLNLPWLPAEKQVTESNSSLHIDVDGGNTYATITYRWGYDGKQQEGTLLICSPHESKTVQLAWVDSWHQNTSVMVLTGKESADGSIHTKGTYDAEGETWGWTTSLELAEDRLTMKMDNVPPGEAAVWAVEATFARE